MSNVSTIETSGTKARIYCGVECRPWEGFGVFTVSTRIGDTELPIEQGEVDEGATFIRCALMAAATGLENLPDETMTVDIVTPSTWVKELGNDITTLRELRANGWEKEEGVSVPHSGLWERLMDLGVDPDAQSKHEVSFTYSGDLGPRPSNDETTGDESSSDATNETPPSPDCRISYNVSTLGNSGVGAYLLKLDFPGQTREMSSKLGVTNYARLNLLACIDAVKSAVDTLQPGRNAPRVTRRIEIATPSDFVSDAVNQGWLLRWSQNGWQRNDEERVRNADLWQQFYRLTKLHDIEVKLANDTMEVERLGLRARELAIKDTSKVNSDAEFKRAEEQDVKAGRTIRIYTDGAATENPGPGGWGIVMEYKGRRKPQSKGYRLTTNNRMEMLGVIWALEQLVTLTAQGKVPEEVKVIVASDSSYVVDAMTLGWAKRWRKNKWLKQDGVKAKNTDLWNRMLRATDRLKRVEFRWVRGHAGNQPNELADSLARTAAAQPMESLADDEGFEHASAETALEEGPLEESQPVTTEPSALKTT